MAQRHEDSAPQRARLLPTKNTLTALKSDVNLESACLELCDNALDAWKRTNNRQGDMTIDIDVNQSGKATTLTIRDNAGGVPREDAAMLFGLGQTAKEHISGSIGTYGVGAKKSLVNLGVPFEISSRASDANEGWSYRITDEWFEDDQDWTVPIRERKDIEPGVTEIKIEDLNYEWTDETGELLREELGEAYNLFLSDELQCYHGNSYNLTIRVDGESVDPEGIPNWSFSPFDGIHPRRFENIEINVPGMDEPVTLHITVGLLTKKDAQNSGTDIYIQKRKIASNLRGTEGGFGTGKESLGQFSARHERLKIILELETEGDGQKLPWDTQKSSIDPHNPVMRGSTDTRGVYNWVRRTVKDYFNLDADKVATAFVEPYDSESQFAVNDGWPVRLDYSNRTRIVTDHRPDTDLTEIEDIKKQAAAHATLRISCSDVLDSWQLPAYKSQLDRETDRNLDNLVSISELPPDHVVDDPHEVAGRINELARIHLENGVYYPDELTEWQEPRYREYIERQEENVPQRQDIKQELPATPSEIGTDQNELNSDPNDVGPTGYVHTDRTADKKVKDETAEIFLVLGGESDDERGAKVLELNRPELCRLLGIETDAVDEIIWGNLEMQFKELVQDTQSK
ncbi:ATP-binding protein [Halolamina salina]|uniref:ATP-binding protein n=1 Tax=Halolamina salina TaxID=1220023 RepID=A0ABD6BAN2_9EURY